MTEHVLVMHRDASWFVRQLKAACPEYTYSRAQSADEAISHAPQVDILIGLAPDLSESVLQAATALKWIHALTTGIDNLLNSRSLPASVTLSNSSGFHGPQMSELAILMMLSLLRDFPRMIDNQRARQWERWPQPLLQGRTACIVGVGSIAEALASRLNALEMTVTGVSNGRTEVAGFAKLFRQDAMEQAFNDADVVIVLTPYSARTHHIINDEAMAAMQPGTILINLSRGGCVDEEALRRQLVSGHLKAAALDVFAQEPLPVDSPNWDVPGLLITPHVGGLSDKYREQVLPVVINNLQAWTQGGATALPDLIERS